MPLAETLRHEAKGALRGLWNSRGFTTAALVTLALGIGATSAVFSVVKAVMLTPLPYEEPERRVMLWSRWVSFEKTWVSSQEVFDYRERATTLTDVAFWINVFQNLTDAGEPVRLTAGLVSINTFDVLGARPFLGRVFAPGDDRAGGPRLAVLGYDLWRRQFGGDRAIIGRKITLNDVPVEVIGVMPAGFRLPTDFTADAAAPTALWRPTPIGPGNLSRTNRNFYAAAVLAPGKTPEAATAELQSITQRLTEEGAYPSQMGFSAFAVPFDQEIRGGVGRALWLLMGAVGFLLLIACVNVANLLLVRGDARLAEFAVRTAIGASPGRLVRQLLAESIVLALGGGVLALGFTVVALRALTAIDPAGLPVQSPIELDVTVAAFALLITVLTIFVFGLAPAWQALNLDVVDAVRGGRGATASGRRQHARGVLVTLEVAMAVILVIGAGLMIRTLAALDDIDLGFNPDRVLTMEVTIPGSKYRTNESVVNFFNQLNERVAALPGVESAGLVGALPLATTVGEFDVDIEGFEESPGREAKGFRQVASPGAFAAMGMRMVRGRWFAESDTLASVPVAVVNETMARTYWGDPAAAVGGRIRLGSVAGRPWVTIVGVVGDERHNGVTGIVTAKYFFPNGQLPVIISGGDPARSLFLVARTVGDPMTIASAVKNEVREMDASIPIGRARLMTDVVSAAVATPRLTGWLLGAFAAIALALAAVGIYGVVAYQVAQRTREIGIRLAIGADRLAVLRMVLRQGLSFAVAGIGAGIAGALALTWLMQGLLYQVRPHDPTTFGAVAVAVLATALAAGFMPAWRAIKVSPTIALRAE